MRKARHKSWLLGSVAMGAALSLSMGHLAAAQTAPPAQVNAPINLDLGSVLATDNQAGTDYTQVPGAAPYEAPSYAPLNSTQPTSVVSQRTIQNNFIGSQSFVDFAKLTPSVSSVDPNGPGLQESNGPVIRGFQDGQFNVTFDGIPIGDSNDFTHHSTSFFMANDIGQTIVDRGPGTAETVGDATFGGTISVRTKDPLAASTITPYGEFGSYGTNLGGIEYDTGSIKALNGGSAFIDAEHLASNGALQNAHQERSNFFGKVIIPLSTNTTLTLLADYNKVYQNPAIGATMQEMAAFGRDFAYSGDPAQQNYYRYNNDHITTDMEYADLTSSLGDGFVYDGKLYTYAYYHRDLNGDDVNDQGLPGQFTNSQLIAVGAVPNEVVLTPGGPAVPGVPGQNFTNSYRSVGTIQRLEKDFAQGDIKAGFWFDHQVNTRAVSEVSLTNGNAPNYDPYDANGGVLQDRLQHNQLYTFQPYGQIDYKPIPDLTITAGIKYAFFRRAINALVNQKTEAPIGYTHNYDKLLPSVEVRYQFAPELTGYVQAAEGFLAPNLNTFYTNNITQNTLQPQSTINFQTGMAYQSGNLALGADAYLIHFQNFINSRGKGANKIFYNQGGVIYKGIEGEAAYTLPAGFTAFANGGLNYANVTSLETYINQVPQFTSNFGLSYDRNGYFGSVIDQYTGGEYGSAPATNNNPRVPGAWYDPYNVVNLTAGYTFNHLTPALPQVKLKLNLDNITDQKQIYFDNGQNTLGQTLYYVLPGISAFVSISVPLPG